MTSRGSGRLESMAVFIRDAQGKGLSKVPAARLGAPSPMGKLRVCSSCWKGISALLFGGLREFPGLLVAPQWSSTCRALAEVKAEKEVCCRVSLTAPWLLDTNIWQPQWRCAYKVV